MLAQCHWSCAPLWASYSIPCRTWRNALSISELRSPRPFLTGGIYFKDLGSNALGSFVIGLFAASSTLGLKNGKPLALLPRGHSWQDNLELQIGALVGAPGRLALQGAEAGAGRYCCRAASGATRKQGGHAPCAAHPFFARTGACARSRLPCLPTARCPPPSPPACARHPHRLLRLPDHLRLLAAGADDRGH